MSDKEDKSGSMSPVDRRDLGNGENVNGSDKIKSTRDKRTRSRSRSRRRSSSRDRSSRHKHRRNSRSRTRSRSHSRRRRHRSRSRSHSYSNDRNYRFGRNNKYEEGPPPNRCVGVFGMSLYTDEKTLSRHFSQFGKIENIQLVYDKKTNRSRGFGFVYFDSVEDATNAKENSAGVEIDGHRIRVDYSLTKRPHTPTPGIYMGKRGYRDDYYRRRSPSPHGYRDRRRSRSYSYSPRH